MSTLRQLETERKRQASLLKGLSRNLRTDAPPSHLEIQQNGSPVRFPIDALTGKVGELPEKGVWGWARGLRWKDLEKFLQKEGYEVKEVEVS